MYSFIKRHRLSILTLIGLTVVGIGYLSLGQGPKAAKIKTQKVKKGSINETITASGKVDAATKATLRFQTSGRLAWVGIKEGERIKKGQTIASLDKRELEKNLRKELNDYLKERWDFEQEREDRDITTDNLDKYTLTNEVRRILEKNQFDLNNAVLDVEIKNLAVRFATLITPIAGIATHIDQPYAGVNITPATAKFIIIDPESVEFVAEVDETDIGKIKEGVRVKILLDAFPDEPLESTARQISFNSVKTKGGGIAYQVKIDLPANTSERFKLGMNGDVEFFIADKKNVLIIPQKAVTTKNGKTAVWTVDSEGKTHLKNVTLSTETIDIAEVEKGLKEGDKIIAEGFEKLEEGEKIN